MSTTCWSCRGTTHGEFCPVCGVIQPPQPGRNHFDRFELPVGFTLNLEQLEAKYRGWQQRFHPDRFATRSTLERRYSLEQATLINTAYQALRDPLMRANHLLSLHGRTNPPAGRNPTHDPEFLMEVMELREALAEITPHTDNGAARIDRLRKMVENNRNAELEKLTHALATPAPTPQQLDRAEQARDRLRYFKRFLEDLEAREEELP